MKGVLEVQAACRTGVPVREVPRSRTEGGWREQRERRDEAVVWLGALRKGAMMVGLVSLLVTQGFGVGVFETHK